MFPQSLRLTVSKSILYKRQCRFVVDELQPSDRLPLTRRSECPQKTERT